MKQFSDSNRKYLMFGYLLDVLLHATALEQMGECSFEIDYVLPIFALLGANDNISEANKVGYPRTVKLTTRHENSNN